MKAFVSSTRMAELELDEVEMYEVTIEEGNVTFMIQVSGVGLRNYRLETDGDEYVLVEGGDGSGEVPDFLAKFLAASPAIAITPDHIRV